jgi:hypothetical protein
MNVKYYLSDLIAAGYVRGIATVYDIDDASGRCPGTSPGRMAKGARTPAPASMCAPPPPEPRRVISVCSPLTVLDGRRRHNKGTNARYVVVLCDFMISIR